MPDIEILARIANVLNVNADYLIGRTNTTALKGKMKTVCEFYVDLCNEERNRVLAAVYKQYMLNRVTEAVKSGLEAYREYNKPWE